ncbi:hypothetical protein B0H11DRAFT_1257996 [Mycena galericulata]|nr:hypothetical protein B0H11DRAFT_1257996 [Mycena galericulata]
MVIQFPGELIDLIISHLDEDSIRLCGLVCRSWLYSSRFYTFEDVNLNEDNTAPFLELVETSLVSLPSLIEELDLTEHWGSQNIDWLEGIDRLGSCPRMTHLWVQIGDRGLAHLSSFLSTLSSVTMAHFTVSRRNSAGSILKTLSSLPPSVETLNIFDQPEDFFQSQTFPPASHLPEKLRTLHVGNDAQNFFSALLSLPQIPLLSVVYVCSAWPAQNSALANYLRFVGGVLQELHLELDNIIILAAQGEPFSLRHNTSLRRLRITTEARCIPGVLLKIIPHLSSPELAAIDMFTPWWLGELSNMNDTVDLWHHLDTALASPVFIGLQTLTIQVHYELHKQWLFDELPKHMPLTFARGVLQIVYE